MPEIKLYGADWCEDTLHTRKLLDRMGVPYQYIDLDEDRTAAQWVAAQNNGKEKKPTLDVNGEILRQPSDDELLKVLQMQKILG